MLFMYNLQPFVVNTIISPFVGGRIRRQPPVTVALCAALGLNVGGTREFDEMSLP